MGLGRGGAEGLVKGNARELEPCIWAEADIPAMKSADLREERGGARASACLCTCGRIASKRKRLHGQVERRGPANAASGGVKNGLSHGVCGEA